MTDYRFLESSASRATEVATTLRALESYVPATTYTDALFEPFTNLTAWTAGASAATIVAGRTGTACSAAGINQRADYSLGTNENATITIGFAWRPQTTATNQRSVVRLFSDANTVQHVRLAYNGTTAQSFSVLDGSGSALPGATTATGLVPVNTWAYLELQVHLHETAGIVIFRVNGVERLNLAGLDTKTGGTKTVFDTVQLGPLVSGLTNLYDDLYISVGSGAPFKGDITVP